MYVLINLLQRLVPSSPFSNPPSAAGAVSKSLRKSSPFPPPGTMHVATVLKFVGFCLGIEQDKVDQEKPIAIRSTPCIHIALEKFEVHLTNFFGEAIFGGD